MLIEGLILSGLATWQAIEIWQHGALLAGWRGYAESLRKTLQKRMEDEVVPTIQNWPIRAAERILEGLLCPFCLSVWVASLFWLLWLLATGSWSALLMLPLGALAASRVSNFLNDLSIKQGWNRTPKSDIDFTTITEEEQAAVDATFQMFANATTALKESFNEKENDPARQPVGEATEESRHL